MPKFVSNQIMASSGAVFAKSFPKRGATNTGSQRLPQHKFPAKKRQAKKIIIIIMPGKSMIECSRTNNLPAILCGNVCYAV